MKKIVVGGNLVDQNQISTITDIPQNRTLYVDQFTGKAPDFASEREIFTAPNIEKVFEHYNPVIMGVELSSQDKTVYEDFSFGRIEDFEDDNLIEQSGFLTSCKSRIDVFNTAIINLQRNKDLKYILEDEDSKANLVGILNELLQELNETE